MARSPKIRITRKDKHEYRRLVNNTRAKIRRVKKTHNIDLSNEINIPDLQDFTARKDFNAFKENMQRFTNRGTKDYQFVKNRYGVSASKGELARAKEATEKAQIRAKEEIERVRKNPLYRKGKQTQYTVDTNIMMVGEGEATGIHVPVDFDFEKINTRKRLVDRLDSVEAKSDDQYYDKRKEQMKDNYIQLLEEGLNSYADEVIEEIKEMSGEGFYQMWLQVGEIDFNLYSSDPDNNREMMEEIQGHMNSVKSAIDSFKSEYGKDGSEDLKGF